LDWSRLQMRSNFSGGFCGDSFWGIVQPLPLSPPFPSECFSHTVLVALPTLFLCATLPVIYVQIKTSRAQPLPWTTLQSMKWLVTALMVGDKLVLLFFTIWRTVFGSNPQPTVNIVYPIFQSISMILVLLMMNGSRRAGLSNPGAIFCIWLVFLVCGAPEFYAWLTLGSNPQLVGQVDFVQYVCYLAFYPLLVIQLILNCFSDPSTLCNGRIDDLFELDDGLKSDVLMEQWEAEWSKSLRDYERRKRSILTKGNYIDEKSPLLNGYGKSYGTQKKAKDGTEGFLLITFTEDPDAPLYQGLFYSGGLFISAILRSQLMNNYFTSMFRVGTKIQSTLTTVVYNKTLKLSNSARRLKTQGEIVNLMAIDVDRFRLITAQLQQYWSSPMQVIYLNMISFIKLRAPYGHEGFFIQISLIPFNIFMSLVSKRWTVQQMVLKDERIRMTNEVLSGIRVVKLYAWEPAMESVIDEIRVKEMALVKKAGVVKTLADMLNISAPFLVALATFATYTLTSPDHVLTPQIAFVSLTLFNQLRGPLMMAADLISQTVQVAVSNRRLKEFLVAEELSDAAIDIEEDIECEDKVKR
uniref:ABC transmembrane type-1 domain-containing protein n=1 Tax=Heligmosomoides polygyrus TaxID=6339 RepID=A0A8L8K3K1_HELPZ